MNLIQAAKKLNLEMQGLTFEQPVTHVYNPLDYAWNAHQKYLKKYGAAPKEIILLGMNPGPWGMAQTGIPFGEVDAARDWLEVEEKVGKPPDEHPKRPILGFRCERSEVSGRRVWSWAKERFKTPDNFFKRFIILNYCPLIFLESSGRNRTPDKLSIQEKEPLFKACDQHLLQAIKFLEPKYVLGVGKFAEGQIRKVLEGQEEKYRISSILHPSPASPKANKDWAGQVEKQLRELGILS